MNNFFDQMMAKYAPTYTRALEGMKQQQNMGADSPSMLTQQPTDYVPNQAPVQTYGQAPLEAPQAAPQADVNPYAKYVTDVPQEAPQQPTEALAPQSYPQVGQQTEAVAPPVSDEATNGFHDVSPERAQAAEANRSHLASMINGGSSKAEITAYLATQGIDPAKVTGLDTALQQVRDHPGMVVPVGTSAEAVRAADPVAYHGPNNGQVDSLLRGALDGITLGAGDEFNGAVSGARGVIENALGYGDGKSFSQTYHDTVQNDRQLLADSEHYNPWTTTAGELIGGAALAPIGGEVALGRTALQTAGRAAIEGAAYGGAYGFNSGTGDLSNRVTEGAKGALSGAALGGVVGGAAGGIANRIAANRAAPSEAREILNAADRLNAKAAPDELIQPLVGHTSNGGVGSQATAIAQPLISGRLSGLDRSVNRVETASGQARDRIANELAGGSADDLNTVAARQSNPANPGTLAAYEAESKTASDALYGHAENLAGDVHLQTPSTVAAIDAKLAEWRAVPGGVAGAGALQELRDNLAGSQYTVAGLRRLRTTFGDGIDSGNRTVKEAAKSIWGPLSRDITQGLRSQGLGEAATAYRAADQNFAQRLQNLDSIGLILGDGQHSADTVADNISRMSRSDYGQLSRSLGVLPADQQNSIRAAIVDNLGRARPGMQDATGERFSLESFLTHWSHDKFSDQAKAAILPSNTVRDLNDLARIAGANRSLKGRGNPSRSGITVNSSAELLGLGVRVNFSRYDGWCDPCA